MGDIAPGQVVGGYAIHGHLGGTTWAETYVAAAESGDLVALKVVDASISKATGVAEGIEHARASILSLAEHLVLRPVAAAEEDGARFIATPLSDHPSLADLVDICPLSAGEAIALVKNIAIAVEAAHTAGVAHLALKPSNIFVGPPPTHAVRIADFGADALRRAKEAAHPWLAPEQRSEDEAGPPADVFALALVAFFTIAGKAYEREGDKPSEQSADVPRALDAPLLRALSENPEERFKSPRDLADALERALESPPVKAESVKISVKDTDAPGSDRHIKATQKLERFRLPSMIAPVVGQTVKMEKFEAPPEALPSVPVQDKKTPLIPDVPNVNRTQKLEPAKVPAPPPEQHAHKRFYLPDQKPAAAATPTVRPASPPEILASEQKTSKTPRVSAEGFITKSTRRVQDAWKSGDQRQRQLVIAWSVFAFIVVVALIIGLSSLVHALVR